MDSIKLHAPATIANISCGFDIFGLCLDSPFDEIEIKKIANKKVIINSVKSEFSNIPIIPTENTGGIPALMLIKDLDLDFGFEINIKKGIPLCGGLGSSAGTAAGVVYGINKEPYLVEFNPRELVKVINNEEKGRNAIINLVTKTEKSEIIIGLKKSIELIEKTKLFEPENLEIEFRALAEELGLKAGQLFFPIRIALTGRRESPPLFDTMKAIGTESSIKRLNNAINILE